MRPGSGSALRYVFPQGFTEAPGSLLEVGSEIVHILLESTLSDGGILNFGPGDTVLFDSAQFAVNGTMTATDDFFTNDGFTNTIAVNSGGQLSASNSSFSLADLSLNAGSNARSQQTPLRANSLSIAATINITGNNFTNISNTTNQNIIASGNPNDPINLINNYWGTTDTTQIAAKITDQTDNSSLPKVNYPPPLSSPSPAPAVTVTTASNASTTFNSSKQIITLSATVTAGSVNVNEGNETFTVLSGINIVGTPVTVPVTNGVASTSNYILPAGTSAGTYTIQATYFGTGNYLGFIDASHPLTINTAPTTTAAASPTTTFSTVTQSVPLTATITSAAGTVSGGTVTFTILNGGTTVATATSSNNITSGIATATVILPAGTAASTYTVQAVYSGTGNFGGSTDFSHVLTVNSTTTTTAVASSANPSVVGQSVTFTATVVASSPGLGIPTGNVTFMDGTSILGTAALSGGTAIFTTPSLALNAHSITAVYAGNSSFARSTSPPLSETVNQDATTALMLSSVNPSASGQPVVFTAVAIPAAPGTGVPTGTVTFKDGATVLATETLNGGVTSFVDTALSNGVHSITAIYAGDPKFKASTSTVLTQVVGENPATATFIKSDTTTEGSWINTYARKATTS